MENILGGQSAREDDLGDSYPALVGYHLLIYPAKHMKIELLLNDFAIRSFRDVGDGDYVSARVTYRAGLTMQYLWASQQAIEKYLKCILLLNRIPALDVKHDL